jgi:hypothetical protein
MAALRRCGVGCIVSMRKASKAWEIEPNPADLVG